MAEGLEGVYDALLLDHIRAARHYGLRAEGPAALAISNPLCGDTLELQLEWDPAGGAQARFSCECCGIAMGNASLMTELVQGLSPKDADELARQAIGVLERGGSDDATPDGPAWQLLGAIARRLPARRTCASLGWQALLAALAGEASAVARELRG